MRSTLAKKKTKRLHHCQFLFPKILLSLQHFILKPIKQDMLTWFRRWMGGSSTGMSVRTVWLSALRIVFTVWMDEQAFISKFAVRENSEGKEIESKGAKSSSICCTQKPEYHRKPEVQQSWGRSWLLPQQGTWCSAPAVHPHTGTQLPFLQTFPARSEQLNRVTLRAVWSQPPWCKPGHVTKVCGTECHMSSR